MKHEVQQQLDSSLDARCGSKLLVSTGFDVHPAEDWPPETGVDRGDPSDRTLAVIGNELPVLLNKAGWEDTTGLISGALEVEADLEELFNDLESFLRQQVNHHWHVVAQEDLAVVEGFVCTGVLQSGNAARKAACNGNQCAFEMLFGLLNDLVFFGAGTDPLILLAEAFGQGAVATIAQNLVMDFALASGSKSGDALPSVRGCVWGE